MSRLKRIIENSVKGEKIYINALSLSFKEIEDLKTMIKEKTLIIDEFELKRIGEKYKEDFISGISIIPQCEYLINK